MDKCPTVELGVQDTHLREKKEEKKYIEHLIPLKSFKKARKVCIPSKRALDFCYHHTPLIHHTCTS
jgi:hypothetical protein